MAKEASLTLPALHCSSCARGSASGTEALPVTTSVSRPSGRSNRCLIAVLPLRQITDRSRERIIGFSVDRPSSRSTVELTNWNGRSA